MRKTSFWSIITHTGAAILENSPEIMTFGQQIGNHDCDCDHDHDHFVLDQVTSVAHFEFFFLNYSAITQLNS